MASTSESPRTIVGEEEDHKMGTEVEKVCGRVFLF